MRSYFGADLARHAASTTAVLAALATLLAACAKDQSTEPSRTAPLALAVRLPDAAAAQNIEAVKVSVFDGNRRIAEPVSADLDLESRTFSASLPVPPGVALTITVEAIGVFSFPDETVSDRGVILFGRVSGVVASRGETPVEVPLEPFVPGGISASVGLDGLAHLQWTPVSGASNYQLSVQHGTDAPQILTIQGASTTICDAAQLGTYACRVRAVNGFTSSAFGNAIRAVIPPCAR